MNAVLTVVTASHRNLSGLEVLAAQILPKLEDGLRWIVKDSGACADTGDWALRVLASHPAVVFDASPDRGIYDALNSALEAVKTDYYVVVGSDDEVDAATLVEVSRALNEPAISTNSAKRADVLTFPVRTPLGLRRRKKFRPLWVSSSSLTSTHSVGTLIRHDLHARIGPYDTSYRILADSLFLRRAWIDGACFEHRAGPVLGAFNLEGVSSRNHGRRLIETYSYLVSTGSPRWLQSALLCIRLLRYRPSSLL